MILKEAYRYQNFLNELIETAEMYLRRKDFVTTTTQTHNRKKVNPQAEDEVIIVPKMCEAEYTPAQLIDFVVKAVAEKQFLTEAIAAAKANAEIDIDSAVSMNKTKHELISVFESMARIKSSESKTNGTDYKFDVNGEQKPYNYTIDQVVKIDFDRNDVKNLIRKYSKEADEVSAILDQIQINTIVNFTPKWDITDTLEDIVCAEAAS